MRSKYSNQMSSSSTAIESKNMLNIGVDNEKLAQHRQQLVEYIFILFFLFNEEYLHFRHAELLRKSDRCKNDRIAVEEKMNVIEERTNELLAERQKINEKVQRRDVCSEKLRRHMQKMEKLKSQTIGKLIF